MDSFMPGYLGERAGPPLPSEVLRKFFDVIASDAAGSGKGKAPSQLQGKCRTCGHQLTMRQDRMNAHFLEKKAGGTSNTACANPPAEAVALAKQALSTNRIISGCVGSVDGLHISTDRRKAAKAKAVSNVAAARGHDKKRKAAKEDGLGESVAAAIIALLPAIKEAFVAPDAGSGLSKSAGDVEEPAFERAKRNNDEENTERTKRARDEKVESDKQAQKEESERRKRAHFKELMEHVRFLQSEISKEKAKNEPEEFLMSLLNEELTDTTLSLKKLSQTKRD